MFTELIDIRTYTSDRIGIQNMRNAVYEYRNWGIDTRHFCKNTLVTLTVSRTTYVAIHVHQGQTSRCSSQQMPGRVRYFHGNIPPVS